MGTAAPKPKAPWNDVPEAFRNSFGGGWRENRAHLPTLWPLGLRHEALRREISKTTVSERRILNQNWSIQESFPSQPQCCRGSFRRNFNDPFKVDVGFGHVRTNCPRCYLGVSRVMEVPQWLYGLCRKITSINWWFGGTPIFWKLPFVFVIFI